VRRRRRILLLVCVAALAASATALAASLLLTSKKLTIYSQCILRNASIDSYVDQDSWNANYGTWADLSVRSRSGSDNRRTLVQFDLASCAIPATATITTAKLSLYLTTAPASSRTYELRRITASWSESTVTWSNQPAAAGATSTQTTGTSADVRREWEAAADVQLYAGGTTNYGWLLEDESEGSFSSPEARFASSENGTSGRRPKLTISYYP
jgi:hypothetical protein